MIQNPRIYIQEWTTKSINAEEFLNSIKPILLECYPFGTDMDNDKDNVFDYILSGLNEQDKNDYMMSSYYLSRRNKTPENVKYTRIRKKIKKRISRFYDKLFNALYEEGPEPADTSLYGFFPQVPGNNVVDDNQENNVSLYDNVVSDLSQKFAIWKQNENAVEDNVIVDEIPEENVVVDEVSVVAIEETAVAEVVQEEIAVVVENVVSENDVAAVEDVVAEEVDEISDLEDDNEVVCPICLEAVTDLADVVGCCNPPHHHALHINCRYNLALHKRHNCPTCIDKPFEEDGGVEFCETWGIVFGTGRVQRVSCSSTPTMETRSRNPETVRKQQRKRLKDRIITLLNSSRTYENDLLANVAEMLE